MVNKENLISLNSFVAQAGICSRRAAIDLIKNGKIIVNDIVVTEPSYKIKYNDVVKYKDKVIRPEKKIYVLLNKPKGFVTTLSDEYQRKNIMELVRTSARERIYPVGRLDRDTTGLIIITNDGELSQKLSHPRNQITKTYYVVLNKLFNVELMQKLKKGIYLQDGKAWVDKINFVKDKAKNHIILEIHSGKKRIIKRMFAYFGFNVIGLDRINYAGLTKKGLLAGKWRYLTTDEINNLKNLSKK